MNIAAIKKLNENMPYWLKRPFSKFIRNKLINNRTFIETYKFLERCDTASNEEIMELQLEKLRKVLIHAYEQTDYYRKIFDQYGFDPYRIKEVEYIEKLPLLTRDDIKHYLNDIAAKDITDFYTVSTGGTSGGAIDVFMEREAIYREWAYIYHYWSKFGYDYKISRIATFRGVDLGKSICEINPLYAEIRMNPFIMNRGNIREYNKKIIKYGADFLYGYPSSIYNYCLLTREAGIDIQGKYKAVLLISENLYEFQKEVIESTIGCSIVMFYGHSERAVFGEKYGESYFFNPLYGVTEVSSTGKPIVTGFINGKMPLIRYLLDDYVREEINTNPDSNTNRKDHIPPIGTRFYIFGHKDSEVIYGKNGEYFVGVEALDFHGLLTTKFAGIQLAQITPGELIIRFVKDSNISEADLQMIIKKCKERLGDNFQIKTEAVERLQLTSRGKYKLLAESIRPEKEG